MFANNEPKADISRGSAVVGVHPAFSLSAERPRAPIHAGSRHFYVRGSPVRQGVERLQAPIHAGSRRAGICPCSIEHLLPRMGSRCICAFEPRPDAVHTS